MAPLLLALVSAIHCSPGGIPKHPVKQVRVTVTGLRGDGHAHAKHWREDRALSLLDEEIIEALRREGYPVGPGILGENLTVRHLHVQRLTPGTRLSFSGGVMIELTEPRKPCYVLDAIHPALQKETVGRIGYMARVIREGVLEAGERIEVEGEDHAQAGAPTAAILAGGRSVRMGRPKEGVILWDGRPMIEHVIESLRGVCRRVVVVGECRGYPIPLEIDLIQLRDTQPGAGPLAAIATLLRSDLDRNGYLVVACDQPLLTAPLLGRLIEDGFRIFLQPFPGDHRPALPRFFRSEEGEPLDPFPGYFPAGLLPEIETALQSGESSVRRFIQKTPVSWVSLPQTLRESLKSMNSPADLKCMASWH